MGPAHGKTTLMNATVSQAVKSGIKVRVIGPVRSHTHQLHTADFDARGGVLKRSPQTLSNIDGGGGA